VRAHKLYGRARLLRGATKLSDLLNQVGASEYSPKRIRILLRSTRGHWTLALWPMKDANGHESGYQLFMAPEGMSAMSEEQCIAWAEQLIGPLEAATLPATPVRG
jgi:hypothetical protein